jgi:glycosyltransferase involved in cell wall biosynthesis
MKIWIINQNAVPPTKAGITRHFFLASELVKRGHKVFIIASDFSHFSRSHMSGSPISAAKTETIDGVEFLWIPSIGYNKNLLRRLFSTFEFAKKAWGPALACAKLETPDIIVGSSPQMAAANMARRLARRLKVPFVLEVRDIWPLSAQELGNFSNLNPLIAYFKRVEKKLYREADAIVSVLSHAGSYFSKCGVVKEIHYIPNFVNLAMAEPPPFKEIRSNFVAIYLGSLGIANNLETVVKAAHLIATEYKNNTIQVRIVGNGPTKLGLMKLAEDLNAKNIFFDDPVAKDQVGAILAEADVFLLPLKRAKVFKYGVSPNKLFDYMLMARPTIFAVETPEDPISRSGGGVCVSSEDPRAMARAIIEVSQMLPDERKDMGLRAFQYVRENHSLQKASLQFEEVLRSVLNSAESESESEELAREIN